jgi:hypothetical protein
MPVPDFSPGEVLTASAMDSIGLWKVTSGTVSASPTLTVDNCFSANYANYRVVISLNGLSDNNQMRMDFLDSAGARLQTNYQGSAFMQDYQSGALTFEALTSGVTVPLGYLPRANAITPFGPGLYTLDITNPFVSTERTVLLGSSNGVDAGRVFLGGQIFSRRTSTETNRGLFFFNSAGSNMTGTVRVYGYRD